VIYGLADLGAAKVERAAAWLSGFDATVEVEPLALRVAGEEDALAVVAGADAVVLAADWPAYELARWVNAACVARGVPFIVAGQGPPLLKVGPTYVPGAGPCFACHERAIDAAYPMYRALAEQRRRAPATAMTLGPATGVIGTLLAMELMHLLTGAGPVATQGRAWLLDMRTLEQRWEDVPRDPACPACGPSDQAS
jgi:bacteriocin biosynthesis cyclodehydratase domain-containing protein